MHTKLLGRSLLFAGILLTCGIARAQTQPGRADSTHRSHFGRPEASHSFNHHHHGNGIQYTPEQRRQLMAINKEFHDKSAELFKQDNITLKEYKTGLLALQKDKRSKMEALLTPEQKDQIAARKKRSEERRQVAEAARMERLKLRLNLSDDQVAKIKAGQADLHAQARSIYENDNLLPQQKMEQMKDLMAKRKDVFKSVLTPEQFSKFEEMSHRRSI
jgi:Spy/CpxP family protein refolding chaperone